MKHSPATRYHVTIYCTNLGHLQAFMLTFLLLMQISHSYPQSASPHHTSVLVSPSSSVATHDHSSLRTHLKIHITALKDSKLSVDYLPPSNSTFERYKQKRFIALQKGKKAK